MQKRNPQVVTENHSMITIMSATNRQGSQSEIIAHQFADMLRERLDDAHVQFLSLRGIWQDAIHPDMYEAEGQSAHLAQLQDQYMHQADKWLWVVPEYNGSYPGVLKLFIDACSVRNYQQTFNDKKVALVGVATGRGGNLRGLEDLTGILHYLGVHVMPQKLPLSGILQLQGENGQITEPNVLASMQQFVQSFMDY